ncbi:mRNA splicing protein [Exophiala dermatitidis]|uniref:Pre-mRNA-splicing factor SLU7 n=1 Tax=Exophiala dermatitidis TaxID=5970 RepID=A0AAN6IYC8_EXODE|nr:mRNA splicing protein [Exophiala dermatitidis]KAJ4527928.1 mRNA splicing protein [Exophiala dermatitidis]KAJ4528562.1 mRNA splicing protein [Exophiala dermatitidis]KAJ4529934.1 mRNA splicing protein [Exophiala dermatitidis]KAJ4552917.1 mRNA splicing protein [Exophiala dermatitidis]
MAQNQPSKSKPPGPGAQQSRNEYIPSFISKRPFWAETTSDADYLEHQRLQSAPKDTLDQAKWYDRGKRAGPAATKFRKGACENCGAMTHKTKECLSRPRKLGARWTGKDIQADEVVEEVQLGWDAKRDRWNGYDPREYSAVIKEYEELEALKRAAAKSKGRGNDDGTADDADGDADARYGEETDMGRSQPTSTRQLRLREDTANYLRNLDLDSARYDPKTRTMDTAALKAAGGDELDADEGFVRPATDDAAEFERAQRYAWETQEAAKSNSTKKLHLQANPTEGEILRKKREQEAAEKKAAARKALLEKYGGDEHLVKETPAKKAQKVLANERYVEYDDSGRIKGEERKVARSKYPEDVLVNNHTSVWGSWWHNFTWGYACCHSTVKNSYCTGEAGRIAFQEAEGMRTGQALALEGGEAGPKAGLDEETKLNTNMDGEKDTVHPDKLDPDSSTAGDRRGDTDSNQPVRGHAKKRTLQELQSGISEEELESYKRNRLAADDPMANLLGKDELVEMH